MNGFIVKWLLSGIPVIKYNRFGTIATAVFVAPSRKKPECTLCRAITKMGRTITEMGPPGCNRSLHILYSHCLAQKSTKKQITITELGQVLHTRRVGLAHSSYLLTPGRRIILRTITRMGRLLYAKEVSKPFRTNTLPEK